MRMFFVTIIVVMVAVIMDVALLYYQATKGKLPFKIQLFPNLGG